MHLYSEDSEWNMWETVGKDLMDMDNNKVAMTDKDKARCRQELLKVRMCVPIPMYFSLHDF